MTVEPQRFFIGPADAFSIFLPGVLHLEGFCSFAIVLLLLLAASPPQSQWPGVGRGIGSRLKKAE